LTYILPLIVSVYLHSIFFWWVNDFFRKSAFRPFKVIDLGTNRKRVLVRHSNLGPILHRIRDIEGFCAMTPPLFQPNFWGVPIRPDRPSINYQPHEIIFEVFQPTCMWSRYLNLTDDNGRRDRQTDRQTDNIL